VPGEGDLLVEILREVVQLLFAQGCRIVAHRKLPSIRFCGAARTMGFIPNMASEAVR
jgi:hypothetical protein